MTDSRQATGGRAARGRSMWRLAFLLAFTPLVSPPTMASAQQPTALDAALTLEKTLIDAIEKAEVSVVAIARVLKDESGPLGVGPITDLEPRPDRDPLSPDFVPNEYGTGVVIDRQGLILTCHHVLGDHPERNDFYVWQNGRPFKATRATKVEKVLAADPWTDLAILKIEADDLQPITLGDAKDLRKGMLVIALGNPYAIARDGRASASWGIISNLARQAPPTVSRKNPASAETLHEYGTLIQVDAKLNTGTSGGALINLKGEMIGLTTAIGPAAGVESAAGFAIPVDDVFRRTIETLKTGRKPAYGFLGVSPYHLPARQRQRGARGARIGQVVSGTPAAEARLQTNDIVTHVNQQPVEDKNALFRELSKLPAEARVQLTLLRGANDRQSGTVVTVVATLSKKFVESARVAYASQPEPRWRGLQVDFATAMPPHLSRLETIDFDHHTVGIVDVEPKSPAWQAGLRPGDHVDRVGNGRVTTPSEFLKAVESEKGIVRLHLVGRTGDDAVRNVSP